MEVVNTEVPQIIAKTRVFDEIEGDKKPDQYFSAHWILICCRFHHKFMRIYIEIPAFRLLREGELNEVTALHEVNLIFHCARWNCGPLKVEWPYRDRYHIVNVIEKDWLVNAAWRVLCSELYCYWWLTTENWVSTGDHCELRPSVDLFGALSVTTLCLWYCTKGALLSLSTTWPQLAPNWLQQDESRTIQIYYYGLYMDFCQTFSLVLV